MNASSTRPSNMTLKQLPAFATAALLLAAGHARAVGAEASEPGSAVANITSEIVFTIESQLDQPRVVAFDTLLNAIQKNSSLNCDRTSSGSDSLACSAPASVGPYQIKIFKLDATGNEYARMEVHFPQITNLPIDQVSKSFSGWQKTRSESCSTTLWKVGALKQSQVGLDLRSDKCDSTFNMLLISTSWTPFNFPAPSVK